MGAGGRSPALRGISALVALPDGLLAGSDGAQARVHRPDRGRRTGLFSAFEPSETSYKMGRDLESLAVDPETGTVWAGYEYREAIVRLDAFPARQGSAASADGGLGQQSGVNRCLSRRWTPSRSRSVAPLARIAAWGGAVSGDPVEDDNPQSVVVDIPAGYRPVDAAPVGKGRALVLLRRLDQHPAGVRNRDRRTRCRRDRRRRIDGPPAGRTGKTIPRDNYEGLTVTEDADGQLSV